MTAPTCPVHAQPMVLRRSQYGQFYGCPEWPGCDYKVGIHPDGRPLGWPGDAATRAGRREAHLAFDSLWKASVRPGRARRAAYRWLREAMGLTKEQCHIGNFTIEQCRRVIELCADPQRRWAGKESAA